MIAGLVAAFAGQIAGAVGIGIAVALGGSGFDATRLQNGQCFTFFFALFASFLSMAMSEAIGGASLGKLMFGYRVVSLPGHEPCTTKAAFIRSAAFFIDSLIFGMVAHLAMGQSDLKQRLGDTWAETVVVKAAALPPASKRATWIAVAGALGALALRAVLAAIAIVVSYLGG